MVGFLSNIFAGMLCIVFAAIGVILLTIFIVLIIQAVKVIVNEVKK